MYLKRHLWVLVVASLWPVGTARGETAPWELVRTGGSGTSFIDVTSDPGHPERIVAASPRAVYVSSDEGRTWQESFRLPAQVAAIEVAVSGAVPATLLLATDQGLYGSFDDGAHWARLLRGAGEGEARSTVVAFHPQRNEMVFLGTQGGLFMSSDGGHQWRTVSLPMTIGSLRYVTFDSRNPDHLYLLTDQEVWFGDWSNGQWQRRFGITGGVSDAEEAGVEESEHLEAGEDDGSLHRLSALAVDPQRPSTLYLATTRGLQVSLDDGATWRRLSSTGLESTALSRLLLQRRSPLAVYAATSRGVARCDVEQEQWEMTTRGLAITAVHDLASSAHYLWAATAQGLYRAVVGPNEFSDSASPTPQELLANFTYEPTIAQVQAAAIRYAEVHPEKIRRWRRQAALKAILPKVDIGMDHDRSRDSRIDEGTFPNYQLLTTQDRDSSLDVSVTWDLGELIWNPDQTSIDVRSKLMVQLRDDLVNEVTRTYFERRRLQVALLTAPPSDQQALLEKELRLQELTALVDGFTGGYFSQQTTITENY
ncbi:MAG: hypothetical protein HY353_04000 [Candidatus Omnitrophica bacterium]|nr:hypothetical protein [Candidatus Omnitrophota bacterium]